MATERLAALRDQPFELLVALEEAILGRGRGGARGGEGEWVGVAFRLGRFAFVAEREEIREVLAWQEPTRLPRAKSWLLGLTSVRGQLVGVTDLALWSGLAESPRTSASRIVCVAHPEIPAGILVDQVAGFRRFSSAEAESQGGDVPDALRPFVRGAFARGDERWSVIGLRELVESEAFLQAAS